MINYSTFFDSLLAKGKTKALMRGIELFSVYFTSGSIIGTSGYIFITNENVKLISETPEAGAISQLRNADAGAISAVMDLMGFSGKNRCHSTWQMNSKALHSTAIGQILVNSDAALEMINLLCALSRFEPLITEQHDCKQWKFEVNAEGKIKGGTNYMIDELNITLMKCGIRKADVQKVDDATAYRVIDFTRVNAEDYLKLKKVADFCKEQRDKALGLVR